MSNDMITTKIQSDLDSIKERLQDDVYKKLCDSLMALNKQESTQKAYSIYDTLLLVPMVQVEDEDRVLNFRFRAEKRFLKMKNTDANAWMTQISLAGYCKIPSVLFEEYVKQNEEIHLHSYCDECESVSHMDFDVQYPEVMIMKITKQDS